MYTKLFFGMQEIILQAGDLISHVKTVDNIQHKPGSANFVTSYDTLVQEFLIEKLSALLPGASFLCEEGSYSETELNDEATFIIDPIDGTTNFICGFQMSAISTALVLNKKVHLGFVLNPFTGELFSAFRGEGAWLNGRRIQMAHRSLKDGVVIAGNAPYNPELRRLVFSLAEAVSFHAMDLREIGTAALGICYTACNRACAYTSPLLSPWDYAAASLVVEESGGAFSDWKGLRPTYQGKTTFVAAHAKALQEFLEIAQNIIPD